MSTANTFVKQWLSHRTVVVDLLNRYPEDQAEFRPWAKGMTAGELAVHIATSGHWFVESVSKGVFEKPQGPKASTLAEARAILGEYTEKTQQLLSSLTDEQLEAIVSAKALFGIDAPGKVWLHSMRDHEIHHKGQLFLMARMAGVEEVPFFINRQI